ncbi:FAD-dependent oxidoreductase [Aeromicrobium sp. PE09-221]|uniref:oxidoreductase n=1 Tax=Aeromicrobium sp. PE09-221 TaxID=1898043 RepID=UPI00191C7407|nr:FAD-dependent oxidoreductase [Aeromicrobium sp. PE09-221]
MTEVFARLFSPLTVGRTRLKNRVVLTPHAHVVSSLWGTEDDARGHIAYWRARTDAAWIDGVSAHVRNRVPPGFEPSGIGAQIPGHFRTPFFMDRVGELAETVHADGTILTVQMILQGGMPHGPSAGLSGPTTHLVSHPMTPADIGYFVEEYAFSASQAIAAGADGVELHLNHDDMLEWFISPLTNHRTDEFGGSMAGRLEFPRRIIDAIRAAIGPKPLVGIRFTLREDEPGGYQEEHGAHLVSELERLTAIDYVSVTWGSPWGNPSYIQAQQHPPAPGAVFTGALRAATRLPIVYTGRVNSPQVAERVLADGHADLVGMARAILADPELLSKAREGRANEIRPCVAGNECINRRVVENLPFSCAVNPVAAREHHPLPSPAASPRRILVVGGGPAGLEVAARAAGRGHDVELWESNPHLGGQLAVAARAPGHEDYRRYLRWHADEARRRGVRIHTERAGEPDGVLAYGADTVVIATGATPRRPTVPGFDLPGVVLSTDVLEGTATLPDGPVLVVAEDDHLPPLAVADHLANVLGHDATLVVSTSGPAPLLSRYSLGSALARLDEGGVRLLSDRAVTGVESTPEGLQVIGRHVYSGRERSLGTFAAVVLSCGAVPRTGLASALEGRHPDVHVLGDAFAPRRLVWATRQAYDLALML